MLFVKIVISIVYIKMYIMITIIWRLLIFHRKIVLKLKYHISIHSVLFCNQVNWSHGLHNLGCRLSCIFVWFDDIYSPSFHHPHSTYSYRHSLKLWPNHWISVKITFSILLVKTSNENQCFSFAYYLVLQEPLLGYINCIFL